MTETTTTQAATTEIPPTAAQRYLAENEQRLQRDLDIREAALRSEADAMSKHEILEALVNDAVESGGVTMGVRLPKSKTAPKAEYVEAYVRRFLAKSDEQRALNEARRAVHVEAAVEHDMRNLIAGRDAALAKVREALAGDDNATAAGLLAYHLEWHADDLQAAIAAAKIADLYLTARRERGVEPVVLARQIARQAVGALANLAGMSGNLRMDSYGLHRIAEAQAHRDVLRIVVKLLSETERDVIGYHL